MIEIIEKTTNSSIKKLHLIKPRTWVNAYKPNESEIKRIHKTTKAQLDFLRAALDEAERPRIERENNQLLVILRVPIREEIIKTIPLGIIIKDDYFITISTQKIPIIEEFFKGKVKRFSTRKKSRLLIQLLVRITREFIRYLTKIEDEIDLTEEKLNRTLKNEDIIKLLKHEKTLVYFNTAILSNSSVIERIAKGRIIKLYEEDEDVLDDVIIDNKQAAEMTRIFTDILSHTTDAYASLINNNLNIIMKFLTAITIILSIPTIISSYYGMNVRLPLQQNPQAFWIIIFLSIIISTILAWFFARKDWL